MIEYDKKTKYIYCIIMRYNLILYSLSFKEVVILKYCTHTKEALKNANFLNKIILKISAKPIRIEQNYTSYITKIL